jgi:hypothetical protein
MISRYQLLIAGIVSLQGMGIMAGENKLTTPPLSPRGKSAAIDIAGTKRGLSRSRELEREVEKGTEILKKMAQVYAANSPYQSYPGSHSPVEDFNNRFDQSHGLKPFYPHSGCFLHYQ